MALQGQNLRVEYVDVYGDVIFLERWEVRDGTINPKNISCGLA
jgi:hypothetical protein